MKITSSLHKSRSFRLMLLGLVWLMITPSIASADPCADKYPANYQFEAAFTDVFQNSCYSCPKGSQRTADGIFSERACVVPEATVYSRATDHGPSGILGANCSGKIYDVGLGRCFTCPSGSNRTVFPANSDQACLKHEQAKFGKATPRGAAPSPEAEVKKRAEEEIKRFADSLVYSLQQLVTLSEDPHFVQKLQNKNSSQEIEAKLREIINTNGAVQSFRTISIGGTADANIAVINATVDTGVSVSIAGSRPVYWYGGASYGVKVGAGASAGLTLGIWADENNAIYGDFHGYSIDLFSILSGNAVNTLRNIRSASSSAGVGFEIAAWFNERDNNRFLGFTITPSFGKGISIAPGGYSRGHTVQVTGN